MKYFKKYFNSVEDWGAEEVKVLCPFHSDTSPSASVNTEKSLFHCWVCGFGLTEPQFISKVTGLRINNSLQLLSTLENSLSCDDWALDEARLWANNSFLEFTKETLHISEKLITDLRLGAIEVKGQLTLGVPVFINNCLLDIRELNIQKIKDIPKVMSQENALSGLIIPYELWIEDDRTTYIAEGEKDMLIARQNGLNAICLTGGAGALVNPIYLHDFKNRNVIIMYDNDEAGNKGANKIGNQLTPICKSVKLIKMGEFVKEDKEDFFDYITKYQGDVLEFMCANLYNIIPEKSKKPITIMNALKTDLIKKNLITEVTVTSEYGDAYAVPTYAEIIKIKETNGKNDTMALGDKKTWTLSDNNPNQILELIETDAKKGNINSKLRTFMNVGAKETDIEIKKSIYTVIYKVAVVDINVNTNPTPIDVYSFEKLQVGKQYRIHHMITNHPTKNQKLVSFAKDVEELGNMDNFQPNAELLSKFKLVGSVEDRLNIIFKSTRQYIASHLNFSTWLMTDLVFNSILDFKYGSVIRGALDVFILGDTQVGKSETAMKLIDLYTYGVILSLKTSTTVGLIGGSNKVDGSWCNTIGAIPRQHEKIVVMEEFSGAQQSFIKTMTDIRSSNELRIARASGELRVPCKLRMLTLSNPINDVNGSPKDLATFPNGVTPLMELITSAEDIARYDGFLLVPKVEKRSNPHNLIDNSYVIPKECYEHKIKWINTRKPHHVVFEEGVESYIWEKGEELNAKFESNFTLFTVTTDKKLARFAVACAALLVNTTDDFETIVVTKEIVDYMVNFLTEIYTKAPFNLAEYKQEYDSYKVVTEQDITSLQDIYLNNATLIDTLSKASKTNRNTMRTVSGYDGDKFNLIFNFLVARKFIKLDMDSVTPTLKFRKCYQKIDKINLDLNLNKTERAPIDLTRRT